MLVIKTLFPLVPPDCCVHCILACLFCEFLTLCNIMLDCATCGSCAGEDSCFCCCCASEECGDCDLPCDMDCGIIDACCESADCLEICMECCSLCFSSWGLASPFECAGRAFGSLLNQPLSRLSPSCRRNYWSSSSMKNDLREANEKAGPFNQISVFFCR